MTKRSSKNILTKQYPLQYGIANPILRTICRDIETIDEHVQEFAYILAELMREYEGVWLSAPQIGETVRIIVTTEWKNNVRWSKCLGQTIMINPVIIKQSEKMVSSEEGCLSLPTQFGKVLRHDSVVVRYFDVEGTQHEEKCKWFNAAIVQHEIDHLDGILFVDKLI